MAHSARYIDKHTSKNKKITTTVDKWQLQTWQWNKQWKQWLYNINNRELNFSNGESCTEDEKMHSKTSY